MKATSKFLIIIISIIISLNSIVCFGLENATSPETLNNDNYQLVTALGVFDGIDIENASTKMSGADFVKAMSNVMKIDYGAISSIQPGINHVRFVEAAKAFVDILGYEVRAEMDGGYPVGYMTQALQLGLLTQLSLEAGETITFSDFSTILKNAFEVKILRLVGAGKSAIYQTSEDLTFLSEVMKLQKVEGQITANNVTSLKSGVGLKRNAVEIDGVRYNITEKTYGVSKYIGYYITAYCTNRENDINEIIYAYKNKKYDTLTINSDEFMGFTGGEILYTPQNGTKTIKKSIQNDIFVIYNGVLIKSYDENTFAVHNGSLTLISGKNGGYEVLIVNDYIDFIVSGIDLITNRVYNKIADSDPITDDEFIVLDTEDLESYISIVNTDGASLSLGDIRVGDVLSIARNEKCYDILLSKNIIKDFSVETFENTGERLFAHADENRLEISPYFRKSVEYIELSVGKNYDVSVSAFGKIAFAVLKGVKDQSSGYYIKSAISGSLDKKLEIKIFRSDGIMTVVKADEKLQILDSKGGDKKYKPDEAYKILSETESMPVSYKLNSDGLLTRLEFPLNEANQNYSDRIYKISVPNNDTKVDAYKYRESQRTFGAKLFLGSGAIIYSIPMDREDDDEYVIKKVSELENNKSIQFDAYSSDIDGVMLNYIVLKAQTRDIALRADGVVVLKVNLTIGSDGEPCKRIIGVLDGSRVVLDSPIVGGKSAFDEATTVMSNGGTGAVQKGDIIRYSLVPATQLVDKVQIIFRAYEPNKAYPTGLKGHLFGTTDKYEKNIAGNPLGVSTTSYTLVADAARFDSSEYRVFYGWIYRKNGSIITLTNQDLTVTEFTPQQTDNPDHIVEHHNINAYGKFTTIELSGSEITARPGSVTDVLTYKDVGDSCSRVIVTNYWGEINQIIVINGKLN